MEDSIMQMLVEVLDRMGQNQESLLAALVVLGRSKQQEQDTALWEEMLDLAAQVKGQIYLLRAQLAKARADGGGPEAPRASLKANRASG
jgi:hypothetical protein